MNYLQKVIPVLYYNGENTILSYYEDTDKNRDFLEKVKEILELNDYIPFTKNIKFDFNKIILLQLFEKLNYEVFWDYDENVFEVDLVLKTEDIVPSIPDDLMDNIRNDLDFAEKLWKDLEKTWFEADFNINEKSKYSIDFTSIFYKNYGNPY